MEEIKETKEIKVDSKVYYYVIAGIIGIIVVLFLTLELIPKALIMLTKAAPANTVSVESSYILGDKLLAKADGKDSAVINVFALDKDGKPVAGKSVSLRGTSNITPATGITDNQGKFVFSLTSTTEMQDKVTAVIDGVPMNKTVTVTFRN